MVQTSKAAWELNDRISQQRVPTSSLAFDTSLFGSKELAFSPFVFVHYEVVDQDALISLIVRNNVALILDLRYRPVFENDRFNHRELIEYFSHRDVQYIDLKFDAVSEHDTFARFGRAFRVLSKRNFWSVCLFDDETVESHALIQFRRELQKSWEPFSEVHPETAFGRSAWRSLLPLDPTRESP